MFVKCHVCMLVSAPKTLHSCHLKKVVLLQMYAFKVSRLAQTTPSCNPPLLCSDMYSFLTQSLSNYMRQLHLMATFTFRAKGIGQRISAYCGSLSEDWVTITLLEANDYYFVVLGRITTLRGVQKGT